MKKLFFALCLLASVAAHAQTVSPVTPIENQNPIPYSSPELLTSIQVYTYFVDVFGIDPVTAAYVVTHSEAAYGLYYSIDQALVFLPKKN